MFIKFSFILLVIFSSNNNYVQGSDCAKSSMRDFAFIFCAGKTQCNNNTSTLIELKNCFANSSDLVRQLIEKSNKLDADQCQIQIVRDGCPFWSDHHKDFWGNMTKYGKCMNIFMQMPGTIFSCFPTGPDGIYPGTLEKMKIACVDQGKIQCNSTEAMDKIIITKNCLIETNSEFKALIERREAQEVCELEAKGIDSKRMWSDSFNRIRALDDCVEPKWRKQHASQQIWEIDLSKKCTGLFR